MTRIRNSRMRRIAARMRQRGLRFQQMEESTLTFDDVAGLPDATNALKEIVDFFHNPEYWRRAGARVPKGVLLYGPPGNGKTLMARATAGESGVSFLSMNASEFIEMFQGVGAARVSRSPAASFAATPLAVASSSTSVACATPGARSATGSAAAASWKVRSPVAAAPRHMRLSCGEHW